MGVNTKRSLGQHFLVDREAIRRIVDAVPAKPQRIVEIGPGEGALTLPLLGTGRPMLLIEKDRRLVESWRARGNPDLTVLEADAADDDWMAALPEGEWGLVSNLPFNVGTPILRRVLATHGRFPWTVLMFQREVADRILFAGAREGGPLGLLTSLVYGVEDVGIVPPGAFRPPPAVHSRVLRLTRLADPVPPEAVVRAWPILCTLFARRRAMLDKAVATAARRSRDEVQAWFAELGIRPDARPDHLATGPARALLARMGVFDDR